MTIVIKNSDIPIQDWFYNLGAKEELPKTWDEFKTEIIRLCTQTGLESQKKFSEEKWHEYVKRLSEWALSKGYNNQDVMKKLKSEKAPLKIRMLFFTEDENIEKIINNLKDWEKILFKEFNSKKAIEKTNKIYRKEIIYFSCGQKGHMKANCKNKKSLNLLFDDSTEGVEKHTIKIGDKKAKVIFDTGASVSIISDFTLKHLNGFDRYHLDKPKILRLITGDKIKTTEKVLIPVEYKDKKCNLEFYV